MEPINSCSRSKLRNRIAPGADCRSRGRQVEVVGFSDAGVVMQLKLKFENRYIFHRTDTLYIYMYILIYLNY